MKKEQIKRAAAEFSKTRTMPPEGKRLYSFEELQDFAISIHDQALEEAAKVCDDYDIGGIHKHLIGLPRSIRALKVQS